MPKECRGSGNPYSATPCGRDQDRELIAYSRPCHRDGGLAGNGHEGGLGDTEGSHASRFDNDAVDCEHRIEQHDSHRRARCYGFRKIQRDRPPVARDRGASPNREEQYRLARRQWSRESPGTEIVLRQEANGDVSPVNVLIGQDVAAFQIRCCKRIRCRSAFGHIHRKCDQHQRGARDQSKVVRPSEPEHAPKVRKAYGQEKGYVPGYPPRSLPPRMEGGTPHASRGNGGGLAIGSTGRGPSTVSLTKPRAVDAPSPAWRLPDSPTYSGGSG